MRLTKSLTPLCCLLLVPLAGCKRQSTTAVHPPEHSETSAQIKSDACQLIAREEIQAVQGSPIKDTVPSGRSDAGISVTQCYFSAEESNKSVSLAVTQSADIHRIKDLWKQTFGREQGDEKETEADKEKKESLRKESGREEEERKPPLKKIEGVGEEAYWVGSRVGGALYVLKKNAFIRISVGGADDEQHKIDKSKALAEKAVPRL